MNKETIIQNSETIAEVISNTDVLSMQEMQETIAGASLEMATILDHIILNSSHNDYPLSGDIIYLLHETKKLLPILRLLDGLREAK